MLIYVVYVFRTSVQTRVVSLWTVTAQKKTLFLNEVNVIIIDWLIEKPGY